MATLNGIDLFHNCTVTTELNPVGRQLSSFAGVNGLQSLRLGTRGRISTITGYLVGQTPSDLNAAEVAMRTYEADGGAYTFVDNFGNTWSNVTLAKYKPMGRVHACVASSIYLAASNGSGYCREYSVMLLHLQ